MSISRIKRIGPTPHDIEFKSMENSIEIIPQFGIPSPIEGLDFRPNPKISKSTGPPQNNTQYGPLIPPQKVKIPLWMAIQLKKKKKCRIISPIWLSVAALERTLKKELAEGSFSALPPDYLEISKVLLEVASDDMQNSDQIRILLKDIREVRQSKIRQGLQALNPSHVFMPNLSYMEINELRSFFSLAHKRLVTLDPKKEESREIEKLWMEKPAQTMRDAERREYERE